MTTDTHYNFAFLDERTKKRIRRALLKAVAVLGYQVPFGSREMQFADGWGTGGVQITLEKVESLPDIVRYGVMSTPCAVIDGRVVHGVGVPTRGKAAAEQWLAASQTDPS